MIDVYYRLVKNGAYTLERVPEKWRDQVKALLEADEATPSETQE